MAAIKRTPKKEKKILEALEEKLSNAYQIPHCAAGHDITHVKRMLAIAEIICGPEINLFLLKVAIWLHNVDRSDCLFIHNLGELSSACTARIMLKNLKYFTKQEIDLICDAVTWHSELNDDDSVLLKYLKDCDRLDMGAIGILRIGASRKTSFPIYTEKELRCLIGACASPIEEADLHSLLNDVQRCLTWEKMLRVEKAKQFAKKRFAFLRKFFEQIKKELVELNLAE